MNDARIHLHILPIENENRVTVRVEVVNRDSGQRLESVWDCGTEDYESRSSALLESVKRLIETSTNWSIKRVSVKNFVTFSQESTEIQTDLP